MRSAGGVKLYTIVLLMVLSILLLPSRAWAEEASGDSLDDTELEAVIDDSTDGEGAIDDAHSTEDDLVPPQQEAGPSGSVEAVPTDDDVASVEATEGEAPADLDDALTTQTESPDAPSGAVDVAEGTYVLQSDIASNRVVDASGKNPSAGSNVATWSYNGGSNQKWTVSKATEYKEGWYRLTLEGKPTLALGAEESGNACVVDLDTLPDPLSALWAFLDAGGSAYKLINAAFLGREDGHTTLDVAGNSKDTGANMLLWTTKSTNDANQRIRLVDADFAVSESTVSGGAPDTDGAYEGAYTMTVSGASTVVDLNGPKADNGTNVTLWTSNGKKNQQFYFEPDGKGFYTIWVVATGKVLDVEKASILPGANVLQWACNGKDNQKWSVRADGDKVYLVNKATNLVLSALSADKGSNVQGASGDDASSCTRFQLSRKALLSAGIYEIHPRTTNKVSVDVKGANASASDKTSLVLWSDKNSLNQRYQLVGAGDTDLWRVRTASSGGWLTTDGSSVYQTGQGADAQTDANTWRVTFRGGWYGLLNVAANVMLDMKGGSTASGTQLIAWTSNGRDSQHFTFDQALLVETGTYFLQNAGGKYLHVTANSTAAGANAQTYANDESHKLGEYFKVEKSGSHIRIMNANSGMYLTAAGTASGSNVTQQASSSSDAQKWDAQIVDGGYVVFAGVGDYAACALDVSGASTNNGVNVGIWTRKDNQAQKWKPIATTYAPYTGYMLKAVNRANAGSSSTKYLIVVDCNNTHVIVMSGGNGNWKPYKDFRCSDGAAATPTVRGNFTVGSRGYSFDGVDYTCYYWTQIYGDYLFHSVKYYRGTMNVMDGRLGSHISHGCLRMNINDAKWIYNNVPSGTKVIIY